MTHYAQALAELQEQPAVAESASWEPPVASDDATNAAAAADEAEIQIKNNEETEA
ncbi:hypothetical protein [Aeromonas enteropelogenes]|uniref:hypothetical protein n=1 Tax=Aeromonas enteropelogenes TaxID=29489 RepID=UPI003BA2E76D